MAGIPVNAKGEIVTEEGYTLAPFWPRIGAALIDLATLMAGFWFLFFFSYLTNWYPTLAEAWGISESSEKIFHYCEKSCLFSLIDGRIVSISGENYENYEKAVQDYYFVFNATDNPDNPAPHGYGVKDYNVDILGLPASIEIRNTSPYFDFATDEHGEADPTKLGVIKADMLGPSGTPTLEARSALLAFFQNKYAVCRNALVAEPYYKAANDAIFYPTVAIEIGCAIIPFLAVYVLIPVLSPYNRTLGKKLLHLALIDVKGEALKKFWLSLRSVPFVLTLVIALFLNEFVYSASLGLLVFLVSWGCAIFTKRKRALHDFCAHSVVVREDEMFLPVPKEANDDQNR